MEVILFETVPNLGLCGSTVKVKPGYFRNFLSPQGLAVEATANNIKRHQDKVKQLERKAAEQTKAAQGTAEKLEALNLTFTLKAGQDDKLFGSVTNIQIAEALAAQGFEVDRHNITITDPIKRLGHFTVDVKLQQQVVAKVKVNVEKEAEVEA
jgi:large subunit ribosomal protein L9